MNDLYTYKAKVLRVVDADTIDCLVDMGFRIFAKIRIRVFDYDAPETYNPKSPEEHARGKAATERAIELLHGKDIFLKSEREGVFNRWIGIITLFDGQDYAAVMRGEGHSK